MDLNPARKALGQKQYSGLSIPGADGDIENRALRGKTTVYSIRSDFLIAIDDELRAVAWPLHPQPAQRRSEPRRAVRSTTEDVPVLRLRALPA